MSEQEAALGKILSCARAPPQSRLINVQLNPSVLPLTPPRASARPRPAGVIKHGGSPALASGAFGQALSSLAKGREKVHEDLKVHVREAPTPILSLHFSPLPPAWRLRIRFRPELLPPR